ncbi:putative DUF3489 family protein [Octadecabacter arcticus 238]|uniref:Putative DUF3489 family protein n=1 Tax=Octadecabacter arcticus 238 TaxID=391616 RepID=M9RTG1_9RHOB|nr:DUF3489 domain-containing protein [Octadecabacter arcticus]AGI73791.1 putative DUF3489 family protein [Octadecabacter arcticus 238]
MPNLTKTQNLILTTGAQRADNVAMPLPEGLHGAAATKVVGMMIDRGWLEEVDADLRKGDPLWRETGDGHGTTLVVTDAGLLAVGIEPVVVKTMAAVRQHAAAAPAPKTPTMRAGTKQAQIIALLQRPEGASIKEIVAVTGWLAHTARGVISGALKKRLGLPVCSEKIQGRGTVYSLPGDGSAPSSQAREEPAQGVTTH